MSVKTEVMSEILPVREHSGRIWLLRPRGSESWLAPVREMRVDEVVVSALEPHQFRCAIVHSTSWRQTPVGVLLTHMAALLDPIPMPAAFEWSCVDRTQLARVHARHPSSSISVDQVIEHGLRHLNWLAERDTEICRSLGPGWRQALTAYQSEPFVAL